MLDVIQIHPADNVCVTTRPLAGGTTVTCGSVQFVLNEPCPLGSKLALTALMAGDKVVKFGAPIGSMTADVGIGEYIHTHNLQSDYLPTLRRGELIDV